MLEPMPKKPRIYEIKDLKSVIYTFWNKRFHFVKNTSRTISFSYCVFQIKRISQSAALFFKGLYWIL